MKIDARSVVAVAGIAVAVALILSLLIARERWEDRGFGWLVAGNAAFLLSVTSIMLRDLIGFGPSALLTIAGAHFGIIFAYFAVLAFCGRPVPLAVFGILGAKIVVGQGLIVSWTDDVAPLIFTSSLINGLLTAFMTWHVWRHLRRFGARVASIVSLPFAAIAFGYIVRLGIVIIAPDSGAPLVATVLIVSVMALAAIILQIGFLALDESRARQAAGDALSAAQDAARARSRFMRAISHEIRTPLNGILGLSELMRSGALGPLSEPAPTFAADIHDAGLSLLDMFDALITISGMEDGGLSLAEDTAALSAMILEVYHDLNPKACERSITLSLNPDRSSDCDPVIRADARRLVRAVSALTDNAIKYAPEGGTVTLRTATNIQGDIEIVLQDDGPGIVAADIPLALTLFGRIGGVENPANGAGVGLTLANEIALAHGGRLDLCSRDGAGLRAAIVLPRDRIIGHACRDSRAPMMDGIAPTATRPPRLTSVTATA